MQPLDFDCSPCRISPEQAEGFLQQRVRSELIGNALGAGLAFLGGVIGIGLTFSFAAMAGLLMFGWSDYSWLWTALAVVAFSFFAFLGTDPEQLSKLEIQTTDGRPPYIIPLPGGKLTNVDYSHPKTQRAQARIILQLLTAGPRSLAAAWQYAVRARAIRRIEPSRSAAVLCALVAHGRRVPYAELAMHAPTQPEAAFSDLLLLGVVQHLQNPPQGLVISSHCREQITGRKMDGMDF